MYVSGQLKFTSGAGMQLLLLLLLLLNWTLRYSQNLEFSAALAGRVVVWKTIMTV